jgi:oligopeptidase B
VIAEVPFVDVLNTMLDDTLPLTPPEWVEWGDPIADPAAFATIRAYSPDDNVRAQDYPAMLVLAGLTDPRVTYWEPAKWVARLSSRKTDRKAIVLRINLDAGTRRVAWALRSVEGGCARLRIRNCGHRANAADVIRHRVNFPAQR